MEGSILAAVLGCAGTVIGSAIGAIAAANKTNFRLEQLEKKVEKHNNLVERMTIVEQSTKSAHHRLDEIHEEIMNERE